MPTTEAITIIVFLAIFAIIAAVIIVFAIVELVKGRRTDKLDIDKIEKMRKNPVILHLDISSDAPVTLNGRAIPTGGGRAVLMLQPDEKETPEGPEFEAMSRENKAFYRNVEAAMQANKNLDVRFKDHHFVGGKDGMTVADLSVHRKAGVLFVFLPSKGTDSGRYERIVLDKKEAVERAIGLVRGF